MGKYLKVYLNDKQMEGLEKLQELRKQEGENSAANYIMNQALTDTLLEEGVFEEVKFGRTTVIRMVK